MPEENVYLEASDLIPLIGDNEDAFTIRRETVVLTKNNRKRNFYIKVIIVLILIAVIIAILVNTTFYTDQVAEYKKINRDDDQPTTV